MPRAILAHEKIIFGDALIYRAFIAEIFIRCSDYFHVVIELGMRSAKDKPMTKKEREEKRRKRKEKRLKK
jgi:hypothetical protein